MIYIKGIKASNPSLMIIFCHQIVINELLTKKIKNTPDSEFYFINKI